MRWLARHRDALTDERARPILEWAMHRFTERWRDERPFAWSRRTPQSALRAAEAYERELARAYSRRLTWPAHGWGWEHEDGGHVWSFHELTTSRALDEESGVMHHCVGLYDVHCAHGRSAIFSLRRDGVRVLTVEVDPEARRIVQARGACNRPAGRVEKRLIGQWLRGVVTRSPRPVD